MDSQPIDITPIAQSRQRLAGAWSDGVDAQAKAATQVHTVGSRPNSRRRPARLSGIVQLVAGACCVLVGIPLLILPGPGLLAIGAGAALMVNGGRTLLGKLA